MNDDDWKAFQGLVQAFRAARKEDPTDDQKRIMWWVYQQALAHSRKQVAELVEAIEATYQTLHTAEVHRLAAKLKEPHDDTK